MRRKIKQTMRTRAMSFVLFTAFSTIVAGATIEDAWKQLPTYEVGKDRACVLQLEAHIAQTANDPKQKAGNAKRLATLLVAPATTADTKTFLCQQLARVGGDAEVPALVSLLNKDDRRSTEMACVALAGIDTEKAREALRKALGVASSRTAPTLIQAVGMVQDAAAAKLLAVRLASRDMADEALWALGEIGSDEAAELLLKQEATRGVLAARLRCAERAGQSGNAATAQRLYASVWKASGPAHCRAAALRGLVETDPAAATHVVTALVSDDPRLAGIAATLLPRAMAKADPKQMQARLGALPPAMRARAMAILAEQGCRDILPLVAQSLTAKDPVLLLSAIRALGRLGDAGHVRTLTDLAATGGGEVATAAAESLAALTADGTDAAIKKGLQEWNDAARGVLVGVAAQRQIPGISPTLVALAEKTPALRRQLYGALTKLGTPDAGPALLKHLPAEMDAATRKELEAAIAALGADSIAPLADAWKNAETPAEARASILRILPRVGGAGALALVREALGHEDRELSREAIRALSTWPDPSAVEDLLKLAESKEEFGRTMAVRGLMRLVDKTTTPQTRLSILDALSQLPGNAAAKDWAQKKREDILKGDVSAAALSHDPGRSAARKRELAEAAPKGFRLVAYLDCGPDVSDGAKGKPSLRVKSGAPFIWAGAHRHADLRAATIVYTGGTILIEASGLAAGKSYKLGLTWWDYDHNERVQTVSLAGKQVLKPTKLPSYRAKKAAPATIAIDVPASAYAKGSMPIDVKLAGGVNTVLSEIWLFESDRKPEKVTVPPPKKRAANAKRILLITGEDYKGHKWQQTAPVLHDELAKDPRLAVDLVEDLTFLRSSDLAKYAAVVMHFKNYDPEVPGRAGYDNLASFVEKGGGLVLVHFACGAFQEFKDDFVKLGGRVWNPKMRGHDPFGTFAVKILKPDHPAVAGVDDFETTDELYTCLDGKTPVEVLATSVSKIDKKTYPMVFVFNYGKGRVYHCPLGHDVASLRNEPVAELFRKGTAWVTGLGAVAGKN